MKAQELALFQPYATAQNFLTAQQMDWLITVHHLSELHAAPRDPGDPGHAVEPRRVDSRQALALTRAARKSRAAEAYSFQPSGSSVPALIWRVL